MKNYLLFDLDGTLTDPKVGICTCVQYALASFGIDEPDIDKLTPFIGPPLKDSFMQFYNMNDQQAESAVAKYRERFQDTGLFENELYDGIPKMLEALNSKGMYLAVASSKPTVFVERILEHFHIKKYFKVIVGSELDGTRVNKDEVVAEALRQLFGDNPVEKEKVYMIGDRRFDVEGARAIGVESVGVTYGYGDMEELREAKADYIVRSVEELQSFLLRGTEDTKKGLTFQIIWQTIYSFLMFVLVRTIALSLTVNLFLLIAKNVPKFSLLLYDEAGEVAGITGNGSAIAQIVAFIAGSAIVFRTARVMILKAAKESRLLHIKKEPIQNYLFLGTATLGAMLGLNMLLDLTGITNNSAAYQAVAEQQYAASIWLGIILYVLIAPPAEELLFRGIIYNCLKGPVRPLVAMLMAAMFFGVYHGNWVQGIYGFLMACLMIYGYEYFGDFRVPVAMHAAVNLISYLLSNTSLAVSGFVCWPVCVVCLCLAAGGLFLLSRQRKVFL
ncbi:MAG: HAD hydrolase-like protein [Acetatifactor sp.]|nr:HAD hydrolase-like protein [Acetatifactor sp.]